MDGVLSSSTSPRGQKENANAIRYLLEKKRSIGNAEESEWY